jgi:hypothetical protein
MIMTNTTALRFATVAVAAALALTAQSSAYTLKSVKWPTSSVPFYVNAQNLDVSASAAVEAVKYGAYAWTNQTNAAFSFYYAGSTSGTSVTNNAKNEVFFRNTSNGSAIATTYTYSSNGKILDTDIVFWDGAYKFFTGTSGCSSGFYIEDVATHEFGHSLGLSHSSVSEATMASSIKYCSTTSRSLSEDDKLGAEAMYPGGSAPANTAPTVKIGSPGHGTTFKEGAALSFSGSASDTEDGSLSSKIAWSSSRDGSIGSGASFQKVLSTGSHTITARVTDSGGVVAESKISVSVEAAATTTDPEPAPAPTAIALSVTGYKVKGVQKADLTWKGTGTTKVDIWRDGAKIASVSNTGAWTDALNRKGGGSYAYAVCEAGTSTCSAWTRISF